MNDPGAERADAQHPWIGLASFTEAVMMSPRPAFKPVEPPSGKMQASRFAPELSATSRMVLI